MSSTPALPDAPTAVYTARSRPRGFLWGGFSPRAYLDLLRVLVSVQLKSRYRYTLLGFGWMIIGPLTMMFVYAYIFGSLFPINRGAYRLFLLAGLLPWQAFAGGLTGCVTSVINGGRYLKKAPFPSELLPIASVLTAMVNLLVGLTVYAIFLFAIGTDVLSEIHWLLVALFIMAFFLAGLGLLVAALNVLFRDVQHVISFATWLWFFATPVLYSLGQLPEAQQRMLLLANPMATVVVTTRHAVLGGGALPLQTLGIAVAVSLATFALGWIVFRRMQYDLPKYL